MILIWLENNDLLPMSDNNILPQMESRVYVCVQKTNGWDRSDIGKRSWFSNQIKIILKMIDFFEL